MASIEVWNATGFGGVIPQAIVGQNRSSVGDRRFNLTKSAHRSCRDLCLYESRTIQGVFLQQAMFGAESWIEFINLLHVIAKFSFPVVQGVPQINIPERRRPLCSAHTVISLPFPTMSNDFPTNRSIKLLVEEHRPPTVKFSPKASTNSAHLPTAAELEYYSRAPRPGGIRIEFDASLLEEILSVGNDSWLIDPPALNDLHWASLIDGHAIFARSEIIRAKTEDLVPLIRQQGFFLANLVLDPSRNFFQPQILNHASGSSSSSSSLSSSLPRRVRWDKHRSSQPGGRGDCRLLLDDDLVTIPVVMVEVKLPSVLGIEDVLDGMGKVAAEGINLALSPDANTLVATMGLPHSFSQTIALQG